MTEPLAIIRQPGLRRVYQRKPATTDEQRLRRMEGMIMLMAHGLLQGQITYTDKDQLLWMLNDMMADIAQRMGDE
jgi:hypothetical protein